MRDKIFCAALALSLAAAARAQVTVINMIPNAKSNETGQDSEPNLTVNPANPQQMVGSAFTFATGINPPNAPIFVSTDGGTTWTLNNIVPSPGGITGDITVRFGGTSNMLYAGILRRGQPTLTMDILRTPTFSGATPMSVLVTRTDPNGIGVDQPWIQATTALGGTGTGLDRVFVGDNDLDEPNGKTATVDSSQDAASAAHPFGFSRVEKRTTVGQDGPPVRPIYHWDGTVYAAFFRWTNFVPDAVDPNNKGVATSDVVVVRDDAWGAGANPFQALKDSDNIAGKKVVVGTTIQIDNTNNVNFGRERRGGSLSIAVDPRNSSRVYLAWGDDASGTTTLHVRRSDNRGATWSAADLITIVKATNPALAVNTHGKVGFLYQQITGAGATEKWETHFRRSTDLGVSWNDLTLAQPLTSSPAPKGLPYIGDYLHLLAQGKDFYGVFSASNKPDSANFPQGVNYQRNVDWTNKVLRNLANTGNVSVSIDPFFFKSQELATGLDFYVRDWTDSAASGDTGLEPSTHPAFYATSDVWNRRGTLTGAPFPNDQPANEPAGNGPGKVGDNWAFARIRRNATSAAAQTVTAHFLVSKFGTGSNYVDASSADPDVTFFGPDPTVTFAANALGPIITPAYKWHLNAVTGDHLCLAVEISTPSDPFVAPSLRGFAPGWPATDLKVLLDNNKAQRNLGLSKTPARGIGLNADYYGIAHNAATMPRDMELHYSVSPEVYSRIHDGVIEVVGQEVLPLSTEGTIVLPNVQPGENRWIRVSLPPVFGSPGEILPVEFQEMVQDQAVDGFAIGIQAASTTDVSTATLESHRSVYTRLAYGFGVSDAQGEADAADALLTSTAATGEQYAAFLDQHLPAMNNIMSQLGGVLAGDPFASQAALGSLSQLKASGADADTLAVAHTSFLNRLDSLLTHRQLAQGDRADILQMVRWMQDLYLRVPALAEREEAAAVVDASRAWVDQWNERLVDYADYPGLLQGLDASLQQTAQGLGSTLPGLGSALGNLEAAVAAGNLTAIEKAHRDLLLQLQTLGAGGGTT